MWFGLKAARAGGNITRNGMVQQLDYAIEHATEEDHKTMLREYREKLQNITYV
jgi:hypothetical protein